MSEDELQIRALVHRWHEATRTGRVADVLALMTQDAVFLTPGRPPMGRDDFAALMSAGAAHDRPQIDIRQDIVELLIGAPLACMRSELRVTITPPGATAPMVRAGSTLTVFRKVDGAWRLARDANLLAPAPPAPASADR